MNIIDSLPLKHVQKMYAGLLKHIHGPQQSSLMKNPVEFKSLLFNTLLIFIGSDGGVAMLWIVALMNQHDYQ